MHITIIIVEYNVKSYGESEFAVIFRLLIKIAAWELKVGGLEVIWVLSKYIFAAI